MDCRIFLILRLQQFISFKIVIKASFFACATTHIRKVISYGKIRIIKATCHATEEVDTLAKSSTLLWSNLSWRKCHVYWPWIYKKVSCSHKATFPKIHQLSKKDKTEFMDVIIMYSVEATVWNKNLKRQQQLFRAEAEV